MALTVSSPRVFNGNVGKQGFDSGSPGSKCLCCPYGYHIDLDFVRYCEAVAADTSTDKSTIERRKKRERRRQCQSMEILLGLVDPVLAGSEDQLPEIPQESVTGNGVTTLPRSSHTRPLNVQHSPALDLSDVVGDFEATLRRLSKPSKSTERRNQTETDGINAGTNIPNSAHVESAADCDNASIGSGNSNLSTGALQSIREQMAVSLERMRELEDQVKSIPMLQVQVSVLKEEKRNLQRKIEELKETRRESEDTTSLRHRSHSLSGKRNNDDNTKFGSVVSTRDMGIMCGVMTRDVGVSHQQVRTRDVGMITSTPLPRPVDTTDSYIDAFTLTTKSFANYETPPNPRYQKIPERDDSMRIERMMPCYARGPVKLSNLTLSASSSPEVRRKNSVNLKQSPTRVETILPERKRDRTSSADSSTNTEKSSPARLERSVIRIEEISPETNSTMTEQTERKTLTRNFGTETILRMREIHTPDDIARIVEDALRIFKESMTKKTHDRGTQCEPEVVKIVEKKDRQIQVSEPFKMRSNVGTNVKPKTSEVGTEVGPGPGTRSIAVGPDPISAQTISLNSLNSRSHTFNYGDTKPKRKTTKTVGSITEGLVKTVARGTDTSGLAPKKREFGTSPVKKNYVDVSVGDSLKPHIAISCAANYCDNCKETIKNLARSMSNSSDNGCGYNNQGSNVVSRIPRPSHINLTGGTDCRKQFKRQDTYTKIPASGVIRYDADNRDQYESNNRFQQLEAEETRNDKKELKNTDLPDKETDVVEKHQLQDSELFQPIQDKPREKVEPSREMRAALKVLNDNLKKSPSKNVSHQSKNATNVIQQEWFKISSTATANPLDVEDYLDCFEEFSGYLLEYVVNMTDSSGNTAMHYAVSHGNFDVVSILLDSKVCDINRANVAGYTAVMLAALADLRNSAHANVANRLFQLADVNIRAKLHGQTALMLAVSHGRKDMTRLLLDAGAAVNIQDEDGSTALMCAAEHGHTEIVRLLLAHQECDSSIVDVDGSSALKIALEAGNRDIGVLLYAHEHVNRGTSPYSSMRRSRRSSKPTTPTGTSPSAPVSPAPSRRFNSSTVSLNASKYSGK